MKSEVFQLISIAQGGDTPIHIVVRAATGFISESWPRILRKGCSHYAFVCILLAVKRSRVFLRCGQAVKQQKWQSRFLDPGHSSDYGVNGSVTPLIAWASYGHHMDTQWDNILCCRWAYNLKMSWFDGKWWLRLLGGSRGSRGELYGVWI